MRGIKYIAAGVLGVSLVFQAFAAPVSISDKKQLVGEYEADTNLFEHRLKKYRIIAAHYPDSGIYPWIGTIIREHTKRGLDSEIWWSFAYGAANCSLRTGIRFPNGCTGPFDRPEGPIDPLLNIRAHCNEMVLYYQRGENGYQLVKRVFYPSSPHDWRGDEYPRMIWNHHLEHKQIIKNAYRKGDLP